MTGQVIAVVLAVVLLAQVAGCIWIVSVVRKTHGPSQAMFDEGYEMGLNKGYYDGRRAARPVVVPLHREHAS